MKTKSSWFTPCEHSLKMWDQMKTFFNLQKTWMGGWWIRSLFWTCVLGGSPTTTPPLLSPPLPPHPSSLMIGNIKTTSSRLQYHRALFPLKHHNRKKLQPNWEQQPKFPIGNNNPSSQLGTTTQVPNWEQPPKFQLGTTTQVPNWEQPPKFPIGNNNPSSNCVWFSLKNWFFSG